MSAEPIITQAGHAGEWISLQEASALLGITTSTLRRWADSGRVPMTRTLGGHRRFSREAISRLADQGIGAHETVLGEQQTDWNFDMRDLIHQDWHTRFKPGPLTDRMRGLGQRLLGLLMQYINRSEGDERFIAEARGVGENYGREAHAGGVSLHDTVEAFLFFRSTFSQLVIPQASLSHPPDIATIARRHARLAQFMDAILLGLIAGYENFQAKC